MLALISAVAILAAILMGVFAWKMNTEWCEMNKNWCQLIMKQHEMLQDEHAMFMAIMFERDEEDDQSGSRTYRE